MAFPTIQSRFIPLSQQKIEVKDSEIIIATQNSNIKPN